MPKPFGRNLIQMVKDPLQWYSEKDFEKADVPEKATNSMEADNFHLMKVDSKKRIYFLGGYITGYAIRGGLGVRKEVENLPFHQRYIDPFKFAQTMEIPPDAIPETFDTSRSRNRKTIERVQFNGSLVYRIPVRVLGYLSLPVIHQQRISSLSSIELALKYRITNNEKYLRKFLDRVRKEVGAIIDRRFEFQKRIYGRDILVATGLEGAKQAFCRYDFRENTKIEIFMQKFVRGHVLDFVRQDDKVPRLTRQIQGKIEEVLEEATNKGREVTLEEIYSLFPDKSKHAIDRAYGLATGKGKEISLQSVVSDDGSKKRTLQDLTKDEHPRVIVDPAKRLGDLELIELLLSHLRPHEREIIVRYFIEEQTLKEVANAIGLSESRMSQMMPDLIRRVRVKAEDYEYIPS